jgi:hypothetical protein
MLRSRRKPLEGEKRLDAVDYRKRKTARDPVPERPGDSGRLPIDEEAVAGGGEHLWTKYQ